MNILNLKLTDKEKISHIILKRKHLHKVGKKGFLTSTKEDFGAATAKHSRP